MASARPSLKVIKSFAFRGSTRLWSNRYYFGGPMPADSAHWTTLADSAVTAEKAIYWSNQTITQVYGYAAGSDVPVFSKTYTAAGTLPTPGGFRQEGEVVALARWSTAARTSKNHPLYLFSYWHGVYNVSAATPDLLDVSQKTAMQTYANLWVTGITDGTNVQVRCGPQGQLATAALVEPNLTHRDFPRG